MLGLALAFEQVIKVYSFFPINSRASFAEISKLKKLKDSRLQLIL